MAPRVVGSTLSERQGTYGFFEGQATFAQELKEQLRSAPGWDALSPPMRESLDMVCTKIARILFGDPAHQDSWHDIAGYATLIEKILQGEGV